MVRPHRQGDDADYASAVEEWSSSGQWNDTTQALLSDMGAYTRGISLLDVGCNQGKVRDYVPAGSEYFGVDVNAEAIKEGRKKGRTTIGLFDGSRLPYPDKRFSHVLCIHTLPHVEHPDRLVEEMSRVLPRYGVLGMLVANHWHDTVLGPANALTGYRGDPTVRRLYTKKQLNALLKKAGFRMISFKMVGRSAYGMPLSGTRQWIQVVASK